ncbi:AraC family transcriptional regulator [Monoraphidium neglectum]|uniref:AraC family transcriptional regulator n=1 Tax=Monoraphidium neglectum TaxID=145388 RepID=A0A0D2MTT8_9CHLO|nr:AraC family transcriptional regulator [Monoraphidium neglectum]KIY97855.1 AraC family transcriptional regulator [Monoraphidium neglectum]|eukprot:XP_013896875.1 AraC family transcriptional regulator [Monoraphidium neglectum]
MAAAAPQAPQAQGRRAAIASCMFMLVLATASLSAAQTIPKPAPKASPAAATPGLTYTIDNTPNNFPITFTDFAAVPKPAACKSGPRTKRLPATKDTVHWGYWYGGAKPAAVVASGDTITVEMLTHQAGDAADLMIQGDKPVEAIYQWTKDNMTIPFRGYSGRGDGKHILTGPIHICGAEPGDTVKIEILDLYPRPNPLTNKTYGSQAAARWGWQFKTGFASGLPREVVNIYELVKSPRAGDSTIMYAAPRFSFAATQDDPANVSDIVITTPCQPDEYSVPRTYPGFGYTLKNPDRLYPAIGKVPCVNGTQTWPRIVLGGMVRPNSAPRSTSVNGKFRVPINLHIGNIGLAQPISIPFTSTTPTNTGNNLDNRRLGKGATLYLPVKVYGGLLQMGDCHAAQGDSEYDGTAIETSITGDFKITLLKAAT